MYVKGHGVSNLMKMVNLKKRCLGHSISDYEFGGSLTHTIKVVVKMNSQRVDLGTS